MHRLNGQEQRYMKVSCLALNDPLLVKKEAEHHKAALAEIVTRKPCPDCQGTRLRPEVLTCLINQTNIAQVLQMDLVNVRHFLKAIQVLLVQEK